ncbi:STAS domain-containing protein, partial [Microbispora sp. ATCC PTA-5024]|uniref:STAS domain-containing protein n=1 Tax=Microbispora sp. ATCC PTA-5024 TaxID=316330 RepID=UPI0003DDE810
MDLNVSVTLFRPADRLAVIRVSGDLDHTTADRLAARLHALQSSWARHLVVDASGLTFCDVAGGRLLVATCASLTERGGSLSVAAAPPVLRRLLTLAWPGRITLCATPEEAVRRATRTGTPGGSAAASGVVVAKPAVPGAEPPGPPC